ARGGRRDRPGVHQHAPVRERRAVRPARGAAPLQGGDAQPHPLVQGSRHELPAAPPHERRRGRGTAGGARVRVGGELRPGARARGPAARGAGDGVRRRDGQPAQGGAHARARRARRARGARLRRGEGRGARAR
ncbi:MAG: Threonine dehydratase, partial [uncultured Gemmatimonadaceae bacterium]